ncbi:MAG: guanylate kinase [Nitrospirae bacterium]|nr:guanylate kinase [Nitrospirota bacterium]
MKGSIFIVSAPSGAGKTTLCRRLTEVVPRIVHSISYTTRQARKGEVDGKDYFFVDEDRFMRMVGAGEFLEWAEVHGNLYGTSRVKLFEMIQGGIDVILDIDTQGAAQIRQKGIDATFIFIMPPSLETLKERLMSRKTDSEQVILLRLKKAREEIDDYRLYDYVIVNERLEVALNELGAVILSGRLHISRIDHEWVKKTFGLDASGSRF